MIAEAPRSIHPGELGHHVWGVAGEHLEGAKRKVEVFAKTYFRKESEIPLYQCNVTISGITGQEEIEVEEDFSTRSPVTLNEGDNKYVHKCAWCNPNQTPKELPLPEEIIIDDQIMKPIDWSDYICKEDKRKLLGY